MAGAITEPPYSSDESTKEGFVRLRVRLDGLKVHSPSLIQRFVGHSTPKGKNAEIEEPTFTERGFELIVRGEEKGAMVGAQYRLVFQQLPHAIVPEESYLEGKDGWIEVFFKKRDKEVSWEQFIRSGCLETFQA